MIHVVWRWRWAAGCVTTACVELFSMLVGSEKCRWTWCLLPHVPFGSPLAFAPNSYNTASRNTSTSRRVAYIPHWREKVPHMLVMLCLTQWSSRMWQSPIPHGPSWSGRFLWSAFSNGPAGIFTITSMRRPSSPLTGMLRSGGCIGVTGGVHCATPCKQNIMIRLQSSVKWSHYNWKTDSLAQSWKQPSFAWQGHCDVEGAWHCPAAEFLAYPVHII